MLAAADNVEISRSLFDTLRIGSAYISSECQNQNYSNWNSIKISFPGSYRYIIREYEPRKLELVDTTEYLFEKEPLVYRVDFEMKYYGMILDAWIMTMVVLTASLVAFLVQIEGI